MESTEIEVKKRELDNLDQKFLSNMPFYLDIMIELEKLPFYHEPLLKDI